MQTFVVNKNTFPRLCNILMTMPIALQRCNLLATRAQLQNRETGGGSPLFVDAAEMFNDASFNSGGLVSEHEEFRRRDMNPETIHIGKITPYKAFKLWKSAVKAYAEAYKRFSRSGQSNGLDFYLFCNNSMTALYLHCALEKHRDFQSSG